jgi:hypothetical protein
MPDVRLVPRRRRVIGPVDIEPARAFFNYQKVGDVSLPVPRRQGYDPCSDGETFRRVWSLWEMLELKAGAFYETTKRLIEVASWATAKGDDEESFLHHRRQLDGSDRSFLKDKLDGLPGHLHKLGAPITSFAAQEAQLAIEAPDATWGEARNRFEDTKAASCCAYSDFHNPHWTKPLRGRVRRRGTG